MATDGAVLEDVSGRRILIPVDDSAASNRVCDWTLEHFYRPGDTLTLMTVIPTGLYVTLSTDLGLQEVVEEEDAASRAAVETAAHTMMEKFTSKLAAAKVPYQLEVARFATDNDSIGSIICKRATQLNAAAIVLAKHTRGAIQEFFIGSVTSYLTHHSTTPIMVLHCD